MNADHIDSERFAGRVANFGSQLLQPLLQYDRLWILNRHDKNNAVVSSVALVATPEGAHASPMPNEDLH